MEDEVTYLLGSGGHARTVAAAALAEGAPRPVMVLDSLVPRRAGARRWILATNDVRQRRAWLDGCLRENVRRAAVSVVHPAAIMTEALNEPAGVFVGAGAYVGPRVRLSAHCVVNAGAIVAHDCVVGENAFVDIGAKLCGGACIGKDAVVGAGAIVLPGRVVHDGATVDPGTVVSRDVHAASVA